MGEKTEFTLQAVVNLLEVHGFHVKEAKEVEKGTLAPPEFEKNGVICLKITPGK